MHDVRAPVDGIITAVVVDEGQLIGEEDEVARLRSGDQEVIVITDVPGVVRELYAQPGSQVRSGDVLAAIDEA
ncbi:MAG: biotin/lipoyl-binding protein [Acidimicrobiia bacterium]